MVIPNYNGAALIEANIAHVYKSLKKYDDKIITIVDDCSESKDFQRLVDFIDSFKRTHDIDIKVLRNNKNVGFASTVNRGAFSQEADILVLLNSDVVPQEDFLNHPLYILAQNPAVFGVGCMDKSIEDGDIILRGRGIGKFKNGFLIHKRGNVDSNNTLWISGGSSVVRFKYFKKLHGFDTLFSPFYWEDIDLSYRALKCGYQLFFDQESIVEHHHQEGAIKKNFTAKYVKEIAYRNQFIFVWKNIGDTSYLFGHFFYLPVHLLKALTRNDMAMIAGFGKAVMKLPEVIRSRRKAFEFFHRSDHAILSDF